MTPELPLEFRRFLSYFEKYKYFRFGRTYCNFRLSVVDAIIWGQFIWTRNGRKPQNCRWNFEAIYYSSRDISTSGLGGRIRLSVVVAVTFFELAVVENPRVQLETNTFVVVLLKLVHGGCFYSQAQHVTRQTTSTISEIVVITCLCLSNVTIEILWLGSCLRTLISIAVYSQLQFVNCFLQF